MSSRALGRYSEPSKPNAATCCFSNIPYDDARWYQSPFEDWEKALERWPEMRTNVEEYSKCVALTEIVPLFFMCC